MRTPVRTAAIWLVAASLVMSACAPAATAFDAPEAREVEQAAQQAFHRMELGRLQTGAYTTNVLVDLDLPRGARITVEDASDDDFRLRLTSDATPELAWLVTPRGVQRLRS
jgi:hypothetical protein